MKNRSLLRKIACLLVFVLLLGLCGGIAVNAETAEEPVRGQRFDFDGSRGRTTADAILLLRYISGHRDGIEADWDVSGDGKVSIFDAVRFLQLLAGDAVLPEECLKVVSYNIKNGWGSDTLDTIAQMLADLDADIVGLQEVDYLAGRSGNVKQLEYIANKAGFPYFYYAPVLQLGNGTVPLPAGVTSNIYGHGILSKYPITDYELYYPEAQGTKNGAPAEIRAIARHEILIGDKTLAFYNGHLDGGVGRAQYQEIQNKYMIYDQYAVFTGDMNETYAELEGYLDEERFELLTDNGHIDHVIVSNDTIGWYTDETQSTGWVVESYADTNGDNGKCSDHNLWYAMISLKEI